MISSKSIKNTQKLIDILEKSNKKEQHMLLSQIMADNEETNRLLVQTTIELQSKAYLYCILAGLEDFYPGHPLELVDLLNKAKELTDELLDFIESEGLLNSLTKDLTIDSLAQILNLIEDKAILNRFATSLMALVLNSEREIEQLLELVDDDRKDIINTPLQLDSSTDLTCYDEEDTFDYSALSKAPASTWYANKHQLNETNSDSEYEDKNEMSHKKRCY